MGLHISDSSEAIALVNTLRTQLEILRVMLEAGAKHVRIDALHGIDLRKSREVKKKEPIEVRDLSGAEATSAAIEVLTSIFLQDDQTPKETLRVPGAIALPKSILDKVTQTNGLRAELAAVIKRIERQSDRRSVWKKFDDIVPVQAMRRTIVLTDPQKIAFYWDTGSGGTHHVAWELREQWIAELEKARGVGASSAARTESAAERNLLYAIDMINKLEDPTEHVSIARPVTPHVRARFTDGDAKSQIVIAPVPFVYDVECPPPRIRLLVSYDGHDRGLRSESDRALLMDEPYIGCMNVYRHKEECRVFGPSKKAASSAKRSVQPKN